MQSRDRSVPTAHASATEADGSLTELIYVSAAAQPFDQAALGSLLASARARNAARGLSGLLLYVDAAFIQVLEGGAAEVEALFRRISADARHQRILVLKRGPIAQRRFADWAMGFAAPRAAAVKLVGFSDYLRSHEASNATEAMFGDRVVEIVDRFCDGAYRT